MKTNKAFKKRIKLTKNGKILARVRGQNHYNAKQSSKKRLNKRRLTEIKMTNKAKVRFLSGLN